MTTRVSPVGDLVDIQASIRPEAKALVMPSESLTYAELARRSDHFARSLMGLGVGYGDRVGILMPNSVDYVLAILGAAKAGAVAVPINGRFKRAEAGYVLEHAELTVLLTGRGEGGTDFSDLVRQVIADGMPAETIGTVVDLSGGDGFLGRAAFEAAADGVADDELRLAKARVRVRDVAILMYTSGTTAHPKGCLLTHEALTRQGENVARQRFGLQPEEGHWNPLPLFHCGGIVPMLGCFAVGAKYCHAGHFDPKQAIETIQREHCTVLYPAFEAIWLPILEHPDFDPETFRHVRVILSIATPERMAQYEAILPWAPQITSYGSTEGATNLTVSLPDDSAEVRHNTLGKPIEGLEIRIVDPETGEILGPDQMGELCFRGYSCFDGYFKDPVTTEAHFDEDGYFHTGDRALIRADGNLVFGGRLKDMFKVGGENVPAIEVEDFLIRHPAVRVAQVVAVADGKYGEVGAAFIQLVEGAALSEQELIGFCLDQIATYKVPRYVRFVSDWPMSGTKVKKFELRERLQAELDAAGVHTAPAVRANAS
ncbi:class I adenylate-forming enzyme family protein [Agromyces aerolatus]|uniref:class I adenylate-forming enzyme family protein n=1 Tax=Agromyces sp. LY-1074 TaxID=3074080 RepID=UPI002854A9EF|nr:MULTISPECIES: class I adenylate-forming enzyme family protein [unclassified Agromyces]MDR5699760.1 class I adenylate-forming enzyme family protein [Agromyces sp. LY-1074]MDR5706056.1 class I adenylate-forming enzyme family protein [Agromyces sp. LY-1358]